MSNWTIILPQLRFFYTYYSSKVPSFSAYNQNKKKNVTGVQMLAVESQWVKIFSWHVDSLILLFPVGRGSWWSRLPAAQMLSGSGERASGRMQKQTQPLQMSAWSVALGSILKKKTHNMFADFTRREIYSVTFHLQWSRQWREVISPACIASSSHSCTWCTVHHAMHKKEQPDVCGSFHVSFWCIHTLTQGSGALSVWQRWKRLHCGAEIESPTGNPLQRETKSCSQCDKLFYSTSGAGAAHRGNVNMEPDDFL